MPPCRPAIPRAPEYPMHALFIRSFLNGWISQDAAVDQRYLVFRRTCLFSSPVSVAKSPRLRTGAHGKRNVKTSKNEKNDGTGPHIPSFPCITKTDPQVRPTRQTKSKETQPMMAGLPPTLRYNSTPTLPRATTIEGTFSQNIFRKTGRSVSLLGPPHPPYTNFKLFLSPKRFPVVKGLSQNRRNVVLAY